MVNKLLLITVLSIGGSCSIWAAAGNQTWKGLFGVPVHKSPIGVMKSLKDARDEDEMDRIMRGIQGPDNELGELIGPDGPCANKYGEYFNWEYTFPWNGITDDKVVYPLKRGDLVRLMTISDDQKKLYLMLANGYVIVTLVPPHVQLDNILKLASINLIGTETNVVSNRIGAPNKVLNSDGGGEIWTYENSRIVEREVIENQVSDTSGVVTDNATFQSANYDARTITKIPHKERVKYSNYCFDITFSPGGVAIKVEDHWQPSTWVRVN